MFNLIKIYHILKVIGHSGIYMKDGKMCIIDRLSITDIKWFINNSDKILILRSSKVSEFIDVINKLGGNMFRDEVVRTLTHIKDTFPRHGKDYNLFDKSDILKIITRNIQYGIKHYIMDYDRDTIERMLNSIDNRPEFVKIFSHDVLLGVYNKVIDDIHEQYTDFMTFVINFNFYSDVRWIPMDVIDNYINNLHYRCDVKIEKRNK